MSDLGQMDWLPWRLLQPDCSPAVGLGSHRALLEKLLPGVTDLTQIALLALLLADEW